MAPVWAPNEPLYVGGTNVPAATLVADLIVVWAKESFARSSHRVVASAVPVHIETLAKSTVTITGSRIPRLLSGGSPTDLLLAGQVF
jgi:hypothetical protein